MLIPHGWPKLMMGINATANMALVKRGIAPAEPLAVALIAIETLGGLCIALGLFTRFWAAAAVIEMGVIAYHHLPNSAGPGPGYEYPLSRASSCSPSRCVAAGHTPSTAGSAGSYSETRRACRIRRTTIAATKKDRGETNHNTLWRLLATF